MRVNLSHWLDKAEYRKVLLTNNTQRNKIDGLPDENASVQYQCVSV